MATTGNIAPTKKPRWVALGRSAATGRVVLEPALAKKGSVSDKRIAQAVKSVLSTSK